MASIEELLLEAELINSTPERVYAWLKERAEASNEHSWVGGEKLEQALLSREADLIDLGIARYGFSYSVVRSLVVARELFPGSRNLSEGVPVFRDVAKATSKMTDALRVAALSNRTLGKSGIPVKMPLTLFSDDPSPPIELIREFAATATNNEVYAIFKNPTIYSDVLVQLFRKGIGPFVPISVRHF